MAEIGRWPVHRYSVGGTSVLSGVRSAVVKNTNKVRLCMNTQLLAKLAQTQIFFMYYSIIIISVVRRGSTVHNKYTFSYIEHLRKIRC